MCNGKTLLRRDAFAELSYWHFGLGRFQPRPRSKVRGSLFRRAITFAAILDFTITRERAPKSKCARKSAGGGKADSQMGCDESSLERWWPSMNNAAEVSEWPS
jgi:hypothetical protein